MRTHRFFVDQSLASESITITDATLLHQWSRVLRYTGGEEVVLTDGKGTEVTGTLTSCSAKEASVQVQARQSHGAEVPALTLYFSPLKRDLTELILQKGTELGATRFQSIICDRTVRDGFNLERVQRILKEAMEQSGQVWLPAVQPPISFKEALQENQAERTYFSTLVQQGVEASVSVSSAVPASLALFVGPEGGWTEGEEQTARAAGYHPLHLSAHVLRAETACIAGIALLRTKSLI